MSRTRPAPSMLSSLATAARGALMRGRPQASTHIRTITNSHDLAIAIGGSAETDSGIAVGPDTAMRIAAVFACVRIIANAVAMCPLILYERQGEREVEAAGHPVHYLLKHRPNDWQTPFEWKQLVAFHLLLRGNSYWFIGRLGGRPDSLFPMHPDRTQVYQWTELEWQYYFTPFRGGFRIFEPFEVMHVRGLSGDGIHGLSVIEHARQTMGLALATEKHGAKLFGSGAQVPMVLTMGPGQNLSPETLERAARGLCPQICRARQRLSRADP